MSASNINLDDFELSDPSTDRSGSQTQSSHPRFILLSYLSHPSFNRLFDAGTKKEESHLIS
jgi:hypothetical protein